MRTVACLAYSGAPTFELSIAHEIFGADELREDVRLMTVPGESGRLRTEHAWTIDTTAVSADLAPGDLLVVAGWRNVHEDPPDALLQQLQRAAQAGATVVSLCTGAFVLAAAGLLDGRRATTHWRYADLLAHRYPSVHVDPTPLYIDEGAVVTSAGTAAGIDACLHLVRKLYGAGTAVSIARHMVVPAHREGGQAQFLSSPVAEPHPDGDLVRASLDWISAHPQAPMKIEQLAARCQLSPRQYLRRFRAESGTTPYQWVLTQRIRLAQELLESTDHDIEEIARRCGFGDATALRGHFRRRVGTTPTRYRVAFGRR
jgi:AraC family transcriptional regulator, transcriptional activator FtrA